MNVSEKDADRPTDYCCVFYCKLLLPFFNFQEELAVFQCSLCKAICHVN